MESKEHRYIIHHLAHDGKKWRFYYEGTRGQAYLLACLLRAVTRFTRKNMETQGRSRITNRFAANCAFLSSLENAVFSGLAERFPVGEDEETAEYYAL